MISKARAQELTRIFISLLFIAGSIYLLRDEWPSALRLLKEINLQIFGFAGSVLVFINVLAGVRLYYVLKIQGIKTVFHRVLFFSFVGLFFNLFLPSSLGGDIVKAYFISKDSGAKLKTVSAILIDRLVGLGAVISIALFTLPVFIKTYADKKLVAAVLLVSAGFIFCSLLFLSRRVARKFRFLIYLIPSELGKKKVSEFYHMIAECRQHFLKLSFCYTLSLFIQMIFIWTGFLISKSIGMNVPFLVFMLILPITGIMAMFPSLGGLGIREASLVYFLTSYASSNTAAAYALASDILVYGFGLFCGILYLVLGGKMQIRGVKINDR